jgi:hypothetical protein
MADKSPTNWIDYLISLSPVIQTAIWAGAAIGAVFAFRSHLQTIAESLVTRIREGDKLITPWITVERRVEQVQRSEVVDTKIEESVRSVLSSAKVQAGSDVNFQEIAEKLLSKIRKDAFLTIDTTRIKDARGRIWSVPYSEFQSIGLLLRYIWIEAGVFSTSSYGIEWRIKNDTADKYLDDVGSKYAQRVLRSRWDDRTLNEVGINVGDKISVHRIGSREVAVR